VEANEEEAKRRQGALEATRTVLQVFCRMACDPGQATATTKVDADANEVVNTQLTDISKADDADLIAVVFDYLGEQTAAGDQKAAAAAQALVQLLDAGATRSLALGIPEALLSYGMQEEPAKAIEAKLIEAKQAPGGGAVVGTIVAVGNGHVLVAGLGLPFAMIRGPFPALFVLPGLYATENAARIRAGELGLAVLPSPAEVHEALTQEIDAQAGAGG
jgi:hypothetical protein